MNMNSYVTYMNTLGFKDTSDEINKVYKEVPGFSALGIMNLLNIAVRHLEGDEIYYEVGTYNGRTLIGAMIGSDKRGVGVDNFSEFSTDPVSQERAILDRIKNYGLEEQIEFIVSDYREFKPIKPVGVYFYDGNHDTDKGYEALKYIEPYLADEAVIIVDDYSGEGVWQSVIQFCARHVIKARPLFLMHTNDFPNPQQMWWNGICVIGWNKTGKYR